MLAWSDLDAGSNGHSWQYSEPYLGNHLFYHMEGLWDADAEVERPLSFYGRYLELAHGHTWEPTAFRPSGHYGPARFDRFDYHDADWQVLATQEESRNVQHTGEREGGHPPVVLCTNKEVNGWPFVGPQGSFSFTPVFRNRSWEWGKQPSDPGLEKSPLQSVE